MELVCPAGNLPALKAAVDNGADAVYIGFQDDTNARHFPGLNFNEQRTREGIEYAHRRGCKVFLAINTFPQADSWSRWQRSVDLGADLGVDTLILADMGVLAYAAEKYPDLPRHLSVQGSATSKPALSFYHQQFGIRRAVLPRVLSLTQVQRLAEKSPVELEVFGFGSLCIMVEGRCHLSSYVTGQSPNCNGVCSPAKDVRGEQTPQGQEARLNNVLIDRFQPDEKAGYPTLCKGRFRVGDHVFHSLEEPTSLNTMDMLAELHQAGIKAIKLEGRQRSPAYTAKVTQVWREAIDRLLSQPQNFQPEPRWHAALETLSEGTQTTLGAYHRPWQ